MRTSNAQIRGVKRAAVGGRRARLSATAACKNMLACVIAMMLMSASAIAAELLVKGGDCGEPVHLVAREARLSNVLRSLSEAQHFGVSFQSEYDPFVTIDAQLSLVDLVRRVAYDVNFIIEQASNSRCPADRRVVKVLVLPNGGDKNRPGNLATGANASGLTPEMERIGRKTLSDYLTSHGMADQSAEDLAVK